MAAQNHCLQKHQPMFTVSPEKIADRNNRRRCWEINHFFKCPTIGMCLTLAEQKQLLKKLGLLGKTDGAYDIHEKLVASLESENRLSRRVDSLLDRKYGKKIMPLLSLGADAFVAKFKADMENGDVAMALWAAGIHPHLSLEACRIIFGEIHMSMHWAAEERLRISHKLARQERDVALLKERGKTLSGEHRSMRKELDGFRNKYKRLESALVASRRENAHLQASLATLEHPRQAMDLEAENHALGQDNASLALRLEKALRQVAILEEENHRLKMKIDEVSTLNNHVQEETEAIIGEMSSWNRCDSTCPSFDLCKKRILMVGGITRIKALYRELIESHGGVFEYHDGYIKKGAKYLEGCFKRADMVICPVNCNSHAACLIVKNLGKKHNKPVHLLPNSSLSAISQVISKEDDGRKDMLVGTFSPNRGIVT